MEILTKKQHIDKLSADLRGIADKFSIQLDKKAIITWDSNCKEVGFEILKFPSKNRTMQAMCEQKHIPKFMVINTDNKILFDIDSYIALECSIDRFNRGAFMRLEYHITQNYKHKELIL